MPRNRTTAEILTKYYGPNLVKLVQDQLDSCGICQAVAPNTRRKPPLGIHRRPLWPKMSVALDLAVGLPKTTMGHKNVLIMVCTATRFIMAAPLRTREAEEITNAFASHWVMPMGLPLQVNTDNDRSFMGAFSTFCTDYNIKLTHSLPYSPQGNGKAEAAVKVVKQALRSISTDQHDKWHRHLPILINALNATAGRSTKLAPEKAVFGYASPRPGLSPINTSPDIPKSLDRGKAVERFFWLNEESDKDRKTALAAANRSRGDEIPVIPRGSLVWRKIFNITPGQGRVHALGKKFDGPWIVKQQDKHYCEIHHLLKGTEARNHVSHLKPYVDANTYAFKLPVNWNNHLINLIKTL